MVGTALGLASPDFCARLRRHRDAKRWSQERLAEEAEMDHSLVSRVERGERAPTRESIGKFCVGLGLCGADAEALWLAAGFLPPEIDPGDLCAALSLVRDASIAEINAARRLIVAARQG